MSDKVDRFLAEHPLIDTFELLLPDLVGIPRGKRLSVDELKSALAGHGYFPSTVYAIDTTGANVDESGLVWEEGDADRPLSLDSASLRAVPWHANRAQILGGLNDHDGSAFFGDCRRALIPLIDALAAQGWRAAVALELEFYLFDPQPSNDGRPQVPVSLRKGRRADEIDVYLHEQLDEHGPFFELLDSYCAAQDIPAKSAVAEFAPGQFEVNLEHVADPLQACDDALMFKRCVKNAALQSDLSASFMAKPFEAHSGSGLHIHISLIDDQNRNVFGELSGGEERLRHAVWGLQRVMAESMLFCAPNGNSYRRLQPDSYAPLAPSWGINNRTVALRIPAGPEKAKRIEHRLAGADANPYLVTASALAGIMHGLKEQGDPSEPIVGNAYEQTKPSLPLSWESAIAALRQATVLPQYFDPRLMKLYAACREAEMRRFNARISTLDYEWYRTVV